MLMVARWGVVGGISEKGEEIKYKLIVTNYSQGCKIQHRKQSSQRTHMHDPWTWTMVWGLSEGVGGLGQGRQRGKNGANAIT